MINVLACALNLLPTQTIKIRKYRPQLHITETGQINNVYAPVTTFSGSIQPADTDTLYKLGIGNAGDIWFMWVRTNALSISELNSNDIIIDANGNEFNIFRSDKWSQYPAQDWNKIFLKRIKPYGRPDENNKPTEW